MKKRGSELLPLKNLVNGGPENSSCSRASASVNKDEPPGMSSDSDIKRLNPNSPNCSSSDDELNPLDPSRKSMNVSNLRPKK